MNAKFLISSKMLLSTLAALLLLPLAANAESVTMTGKMNGLNCVLTGYVCPVDKKDPIKALETDFVLQTPDGKFYYLTNLSRDVKASYFLDSIEVSGELNSKYDAIQVDALKVRQGDAYKTVWSQKMHQEALKELFGPPGH